MYQVLGRTIWLGGTDAAVEGVWIWSHSGQPIILDEWNPGEPNNELGEDCMNIFHDWDQWNDADCTNTWYPVCEG